MARVKPEKSEGSKVEELREILEEGYKPLIKTCINYVDLNLNEWKKDNLTLKMVGINSNTLTGKMYVFEAVFKGQTYEVHVIKERDGSICIHKITCCGTRSETMNPVEVPSSFWQTPYEYKSNINLNNLNNKEENTMRRTININLIDDDKALPVENALVARFKNIVTEESDDVTIQELIMNEDVKGLLDKHNKVRTSIVNQDILERTGNEVKLRGVKLKNLRWEIK